ncbi:hypothetical protein GJ744_002964 [Endocarpon pusillum]|uniref:Uncharacterized protein n=1 Tax=Endocarpon pusillum TaxID=364733 RepID=A0A8H7A9K5_9EURO|nr:hypothetical protein GJ744_002964 [Endocarpon pusillum]
MAKAFMYVFFAYSGFQQPFYILSEIRTPRKTFPRSTLTASFLILLLFVSVNLAYVLVVAKDLQHDHLDVPMATLFFSQVLRSWQAQQATAALTALSIFGNIVLTALTTSQVNQEIAKEGILPYGIFFAKSYYTVYGWLSTRSWRHDHLVSDDKVPIPALGLTLASSLVLIGLTAMLPPLAAFEVVVELYTYFAIILVPTAVSGGLLYLKFRPKSTWASRASFKPWLSSLFPTLYFITSALLAITLFVDPAPNSPLELAPGSIKCFIVPAIGISTLAWGSAWFLGLKIHGWWYKTEILAMREALVVQVGEDEYVQLLETVDASWEGYEGSGSSGKYKERGTNIKTD